MDANSIEILSKGDYKIKLTVLEVIKEDRSIWKEIADHTTRFVISPRSMSVRYRNSNSLSIPLFSPNVGNLLGQSFSYGPMSPGLDFAFGFTDESYVYKALDRGWLITDDGQTSPAVWSRTNELNFELTLELFKGIQSDTYHQPYRQSH